MNTRLVLAVLLSLAAGAALKGYGQDKPAPPAARIATVDLRLCYDKDHYDRIKDVDAELQKIADDIAPRLKEGDPKERERLRADYLEFYARKKLAIYQEIARVAGVVAKERGYTMVVKSDRVPVPNDPESISAQINSRPLVWHDSASDLTDEILKRLNEAYAELKKKGKDKEKDF